MTSSSVRLLQIVSLLASRPSWSAAELAARTEVTERTVRRDVARPRHIGYGVESDPGRLGGYRLDESIRPRSRHRGVLVPGPLALYATVRLPVPAAKALCLIPPTSAMHKQDGDDERTTRWAAATSARSASP